MQGKWCSKCGRHRTRSKALICQFCKRRARDKNRMPTINEIIFAPVPEQQPQILRRIVTVHLGGN
jgi:hypothetical protein